MYFLKTLHVLMKHVLSDGEKERKKDKFWIILFSSGPFVTGLEYAADCKAEVVGKPEKSFFLSAIEEFNCQPDECIMIGDVSSLYTQFRLINLAQKIRQNCPDKKICWRNKLVPKKYREAD